MQKKNLEMSPLTGIESCTGETQEIHDMWAVTVI